MTKEFLARFPEVTIDLDLSHRMADLVEDNIDVAIRITDPRDSSLVARRLAPVPIFAVAAPSYLGCRGTPKKPIELRDHCGCARTWTTWRRGLPAAERRGANGTLAR